MSSAVLFAASGDFYAAHPSKDGTSLGQQKVRHRYLTLPEPACAQPSWYTSGKIHQCLAMDIAKLPCVLLVAESVPHGSGCNT